MTVPTLTPVQSSNIAALGHHEGHLYVRFKDGVTWRYLDVPAETHTAMHGSPSVGKFFHANIRNKFNGEKVPA